MKMKKLASLLLVLAMVLTLSVSAFATSGTNNDNGEITIDNAVVGQTYTIYQILKLESYNVDADAYAYKATDAWANFINSAAIKGVYVDVDDQGYVTWKGNADPAIFAGLAQAYAKANNITNQGSKEAESTTVEFTGLNLGYYLVDSTLGSLCSLDTTNPSVTIKEKNAAPTNEKKVEEDSTGYLGKENDADIGQKVKFVSEVTLPAGSENVVFHDKMSEGLTLPIEEPGCVMVYEDAALTKEIPDGNYNKVVRGLTDGCTFEIDFTNTIGLWDKVYVVYYAYVNENAVVGGNGNPNESWLNYGEEGKTTTVPSKTTTYTWKIDVFKYTVIKATEEGKEDTEKALDGAVFILSKNSDGTNPIKLVSKGGNVYRVATADDETTITEITTDATGAFTIEGLDSDTYYLIEKTAPAGYNTLSAPIKVVIDHEGKVTYNEDSTGTVKVLNKSGTELPSTGGTGTTIFYVLGSILVVAAGVLLVTKKRMSDRA